MSSETRLFERFDDIGRVESSELCPLSGILDNVSREGCKVHYNFPVVVDLDNDYEIKMTFARNASEGSLQLICHPQWVREENGCTEIGFKILPSKEYPRLIEYIEKLGLEAKSEDFGSEINSSNCQFI